MGLTQQARDLLQGQWAALPRLRRFFANPACRGGDGGVARWLRLTTVGCRLEKVGRMAVFELSVSRDARSYGVQVVRSPAGEASADFEVDVGALLAQREPIQAALLASAAATRGRLTPLEKPVREMGMALFTALFSSAAVAGRYQASLAMARDRGESLRVVLRVADSELAALPWEAMYDAEADGYVCRSEPLVRRMPVAAALTPLSVTAPLRILGIVSAPRGLAALDVDKEREQLTAALSRPIRDGAVDLTWAPDATWETLQELLLTEQWHVVHFIGHGDFDIDNAEGILALVGDDGRVNRVSASRFADLLREARPTPRLVVLNSCASATSGAHDLFSGTAAALVRSGIRAVAAMQFSVTDRAAIAFSRAFYTALAHGRGVDDAVHSGRVGILGTSGHTLEWLTPVLYLRGDDAHLFSLTPTPGPTPIPERPAVTPLPAHPATGDPPEPGDYPQIAFKFFTMLKGVFHFWTPTHPLLLEVTNSGPAVVESATIEILSLERPAKPVQGLSAFVPGGAAGTIDNLRPGRSVKLRFDAENIPAKSIRFRCRVTASATEHVFERSVRWVID